MKIAIFQIFERNSLQLNELIATESTFNFNENNEGKSCGIKIPNLPLSQVENSQSENTYSAGSLQTNYSTFNGFIIYIEGEQNDETTLYSNPSIFFESILILINLTK